VRVLGIDPGSRYLGFGVVERHGSQFTHVGHGVVRADPKAPLADRLSQIFSGLSEAVARYAPDVVAVEGVFHHKNARSALILGHARGVALLIAAQSGLSVHEYAPARVKRAVGANGNAGKQAVARMVSTLLRLAPDAERSDAWDALAVALCHLGRQGIVPSQRSRRQEVPDAFRARLKPAWVGPSGGQRERPALAVKPAVTRPGLSR
jgi:crossover junction endodeoxyribonuclease RuvC